MKTLLIVLAVLLLSATVASADYYVKEESHTDEYYYGGQVSPAVDRVTETWIGDNKAAIISDNRGVVFDLNNNTLIFINLADSTYAETTLPMEWANLADEQTAARIQMFPTTGTIEPTGETKKIGQHECAGYKVSTWIPYQGAKYNETDSQVWMASDLPFDVDMFHQIRLHQMKLFNFGDELRAEAAEVKGLPILTDSEVILKGSSYKTIEKVVEIKKMDPPEGIYGPPAGFTKKDKLSMADLQDS